MNEIDKLESRITAALDRIRHGVGQLTAAAVQPATPTPEVEDETAALRYQLQEEQTVTAQLEERVRVLKERQDGNVTELTQGIAAQTQKATALEAKIDVLRAENAALQATNATLRDEAGDDTEALYHAALAEVETLKAKRAADAAEMDAIISELKPLIEEA